MSDSLALDWLDRLLAQDEESRAASLRDLATQDPELHARLQRLVAAALSPEHSRAFARAVVDGFGHIALDATRSLASGQVLAGYRLIRELGRGGMSVVWLAERADGALKREVALKMPMFMLQGAGEEERFARERDALASLSHPNVARLYDAGVLPSGQPFIVLERVDGASLIEFCDGRKLDIAARLRLFFQVLAAVEHAHRHLVVHRDLKPSNILVDADGQVKLLDFGIAKLLGEGEAATAPLTQQMGAAMTPLYAAPEQIRGAVISTLTDVFSLGIVLQELLTGALPYRGQNGARASLPDVLEAFGRGELPGAGLTGDLDIIVGKALRLAPEDRYASVAHMADDLRRYMGHKPIAARRPGFWYSARLAVQRHRLASIVAAVGLALVLGASFVAWQQYRESLANARRAAAVRDFMFDLVNDAEATEGHEGEVTGRQMVDGAVSRARRDFGAQPQLRGELLGELGRMYMRLGAIAQAVPVIEESSALLEKTAPAGDPALNKSLAFLADALLQSGADRERVSDLAVRARAGCVSAQADCAKARAYAGNTLSQVASYTGDDETALIEMRRSAADIALGFGASHEEYAMALMSLAIIARNAGHLTEAGDAIERALAIARALRMRAADRNDLERTMAVIDYDLGRYAVARDRLVALRSRPSSAGNRALQERLLANVYVELGDAPRALHSAAAAIAAIPPEEEEAEMPYALQAQARALALAGHHDEALARIDGVIARFRAGEHAPDSFEVLRAVRYRAQFLLLAGRAAPALQALQALRVQHGDGKASSIEYGLALDSLGEALRMAGDSAAAREAHLAAQVQLAKQLPEDHPHLIHNKALLNGA